LTHRTWRSGQGRKPDVHHPNFSEARLPAGSLGVHRDEQTDRVRRHLKAELKRADVSYYPAEALPRLGGDGETVEVDGGYFGGYIKPPNHRENRRDRRLAKNQNGKRRVVVVMRECGGRTLPAVFR